MTTPVIHVHTQTDKNTVEHVKFMWSTMIKLASKPDSLKLTAHCMGPVSVEKLNGNIQNGSTRQVIQKSKDGLHGSYGHAACIIDAFSMTNDGSIHVIADSDTVVVAKGWDDYVRKRIITDSVGIMGTTYEDVGGFSSGKDSVQTYKKIPTFTWAALNPIHDWKPLDVRPNKAHRVHINSEKLSKIYNLPIGYHVFGEAAWQVPQFLFDHGITYDGWQQRKGSTDAIVLKGLNNYHEEYHAEGIPFVVHHRGSMRHPFRGDKMSRIFYETVDRYIETEMRLEPRWTWEDATWTPQVRQEDSQKITSEQAQNDAENLVDIRNEWLKISFNGTPVRRRSALNRSTTLSIEFEKPAHTLVAHLRVEGKLGRDCELTIPEALGTPYMITCRNATMAGVAIKASGTRYPVTIPADTTWMILVDVDGTQHVE
jgi:hypothetical protein